MHENAKLQRLHKELVLQPTTSPEISNHTPRTNTAADLLEALSFSKDAKILWTLKMGITIGLAKRLEACDIVSYAS